MSVVELEVAPPQPPRGGGARRDVGGVGDDEGEEGVGPVGADSVGDVALEGLALSVAGWGV